MSDFGDIRSAINKKDNQQLNLALLRYAGKTPPQVAIDYALKCALKNDMSIAMSYKTVDGDDYLPLSQDDGRHTYECYINCGQQRRYVGRCTLQMRQRWLLEQVVKPFRMWCETPEQHEMWTRGEQWHADMIRLGKRNASAAFARDAERTLQGLGPDRNKSYAIASGLTDIICSNNPLFVVGAAQYRISDYGPRWGASKMFLASFHAYMLRDMLGVGHE